jgi:hypothetical protein
MSRFSLDSQKEDPHGVQKLLALLRSQQDGGGSEQQQKPVAVEAQSSRKDSIEAKSDEDIRYVSFAQALPHLTRLSKDEVFLAALLRLKVSHGSSLQLLSKLVTV